MRIALITQRDVADGSGQHVAYGAWSEAEDVLLDGVEADVVHLDLAIEHPRIRVRRSLGRTMRRRRGPGAAVPGLSRRTNPARQLTGHYDLAVFLAHGTWDLPLIERLGPLRDRVDRVAIWFFETWPTRYGDGRLALEPFHAVDDIYVALWAAVEPLAEAIGRPVTYLPMATDTIRFGPEDPTAARPIDLIGIGRRRPEQHRAMLDWAARNDRFYLYDTTKVDRPGDYRHHRDNIGRWYASSRLAVCNYGKSDRPEITHDLRVIPGRLWESLASGAGLVGIPPDEERQRAVLGRTVVEPMPDDPGDLPGFLEELLARHGPAEAAANVRLAMTGHDWAHRWRELFRHLGLGCPPRLEERIADLERRAEKFA